MRLHVVIFSCVFFILHTLPAYAGVVIGGTRLIYDGSKKEASLTVSNPDNTPYLIQSWVDPEVKGGKSPFLITPPLFRLDANSDNMLRVIMTGKGLPQDKESLFWMNIKAIPSTKKEGSQNTLQLAINTRMKLIYRPESLNKTSEWATKKLQWQVKGRQLLVNNPTPYYMNFNEVSVNGVDIKDASFVAPNAQAKFNIEDKVDSSGEIVWKLINDYGGIGEMHRSKY